MIIKVFGLQTAWNEGDGWDILRSYVVSVFETADDSGNSLLSDLIETGDLGKDEKVSIRADNEGEWLVVNAETDMPLYVLEKTDEPLSDVYKTKATNVASEPPIGSYAATARMLAELGIMSGDEADAWKDEMKDRELFGDD